MERKFFLFGIFAFFIVLLSYFLITPRLYYGGDIIEYYGMSESLINHQSLELTSQDKIALEDRLGRGYFDNPEYYFKSPDGKRHSGHFFFYSLLLTPTRVFLRLAHLDEMRTFQVTNLMTLFVTLFILSKIIKNLSKYITLTILIALSPLLYFLIWPGPEILIVSLLILSLFIFFEKHYFPAIVLSALASWQSQPLAFIPFVQFVIYVYSVWKERGLRLRYFIFPLLSLSFVFFPNAYYLLVFHKFNALTNLKGLGFTNFTIKKVFEIFFDPNIGLFFYAPVLVIGGIAGYFAKLKKNYMYIIVGLLVLLIAIFYTTITNWNSGTAGYGPTRYGLFFLPIFLYFFVKWINNNTKLLFGLSLYLITQLIVLNTNGFLTPNLDNSLKLTPWARIILDRFPKYYNPTSEIFIERVSEKEGGKTETTIYTSQGACKKAYVRNGNIEKIKRGCQDVKIQDGLKEGYVSF